MHRFDVIPSWVAHRVVGRVYTCRNSRRRYGDVGGSKVLVEFVCKGSCVFVFEWEMGVGLDRSARRACLACVLILCGWGMYE